MFIWSIVKGFLLSCSNGLAFSSTNGDSSFNRVLKINFNACKCLLYVLEVIPLFHIKNIYSEAISEVILLSPTKERNLFKQLWYIFKVNSPLSGLLGLFKYSCQIFEFLIFLFEMIFLNSATLAKYSVFVLTDSSSTMSFLIFLAIRSASPLTVTAMPSSPLIQRIVYLPSAFRKRK